MEAASDYRARLQFSRGIEPATAGLLLNMLKRGRRRISIARPGSEELRYLKWAGVTANVGDEKNDHILLLADARKIEAIEEYLHGTQRRCGLIGWLGDDTPDIHARRFMIRHRRLLRLSDADVRVLSDISGGLLDVAGL